jgi:flagellar basal body L-ring protein FlgH
MSDESNINHVIARLLQQQAQEQQQQQQQQRPNQGLGQGTQANEGNTSAPNQDEVLNAMLTNYFQHTMHVPQAGAPLNQHILGPIQVAGLNQDPLPQDHRPDKVGDISTTAISSNSASPKDWTLEQLG